jgi:hypothetical protein
VAFLEWVDAAAVTVEETTPAKRAGSAKAKKPKRVPQGTPSRQQSKKSVPNEKEAGGEE